MRLIIKMAGGFFRNVQWDDGKPTIRTSPHKYDAWYTNRMFDALRVAEKLGGQVMEFNPFNGDLKAA